MGKNEAKDSFDEPIMPYRGIRPLTGSNESREVGINSGIRLSQPSPSTRTPLSELTLPELKVVSDFLGVRLNFECETQKPQWKETLRKKEAVGNEIRKRIQNINFGLL